jgi:uncharacterized Zn finger protein (UPF0148 family)
MSKITLTKVKSPANKSVRVTCPECKEDLFVGPNDKQIACSTCESVFDVHREETISERAGKAYDAKPPLEMARKQLGEGHAAKEG